MALNLYNIKKWYRMLSGKSVMHVNQRLGKTFSPTDIKGYYNDLTEKVTMLPELLHTDSLPLYTTPSGKRVTFPVDIFQYGLGAYDLYLITKKECYREKFRQCCIWSIQNQEETGAWSNFFFKYPDNPYGAMAQGEAASLLLRGYKEFGDTSYFDAAQKAIDFMLLPLENNGTTIYEANGDILLCEYTHLPIVLNGWIFALWGLYDYTLLANEDKYKDIFMRTEIALAKRLHKFSRHHWSMYDLSGKMTSPFYHRLHIAQMQAMYKLTEKDIYNEYAILWTKRLHNPLWKGMAFTRKVWQKINEKEAWT